MSSSPVVIVIVMLLLNNALIRDRFVARILKLLNGFISRALTNRDTGKTVTFGRKTKGQCFYISVEKVVSHLRLCKEVIDLKIYKI